MPLGRRWFAFASLGAVVAIACASLIAGTVYAGSVVDFSPAGTQPPLLTPLDPSNDCGGCHAGTGNEATFMPHPTWAGSMMAQATRDPVFWAALDVANHDAPGVGEWCLRCHAPNAWYAGRVPKAGQPNASTGAAGCLLQGSPALGDTVGNDYAGIGCAFCHRMMPNGPQGQPTLIGNGDVWLDDAASCQGQPGPCYRGPYDYAAGDSRAPPHRWQASSFHRSSAMCGTCHDVSSPPGASGPVQSLIDAGLDTGRAFPIERTYGEWRASLFADMIFADGVGGAEELGSAPFTRAQECQDCHMPVSTDAAARACNFNPAGSRAGELKTHELAGANAWVPGLIAGEFAGSNATLTAALARTSASARALLAQRTARIEIALDPLPAGATTLRARVRVVNLTGHKLPTGYSEGRRMWLEIVARDADGDRVFESAAYDQASGVLTEDAQARVYEVQQGIWNATTQQCEIADAQGRKTFHFVRNDCVRKDNRIPPLGFRAANDIELKPVGTSFPLTAPGSGQSVNYDLATYSIALPANARRPISVTATLRAQVASREYIEFLRDQANTHGFAAENILCAGGPGRPFTVGAQNRSRGQYLFELWSNPVYGRSPPEPVASASASTNP
jgi:hypothetical protein